MKRILVVVLALLALVWASSLAAGNSVAGMSSARDAPSPESTVTCGGVGFDWPYGVIGKSVADTVSTEQCNGSCASCITSLENQGCKVVDTVVAEPALEGWTMTIIYQLSCVSP